MGVPVEPEVVLADLIHAFLLGQSLRQAGHGVEAHQRVGVVVVDAFDVQRRDAACLGQRQLMGLCM